MRRRQGTTSPHGQVLLRGQLLVREGCEAREIVGMLGSHHLVPPGEVEAEVIASLRMVQIVMGRGGEEAH